MAQTRYRLLVRAQMHGAVREPGYIFTLLPGERGPHRARVITNTGGPGWRHFAADDAPQWRSDLDDPVRDEPLFVLTSD